MNKKNCLTILMALVGAAGCAAEPTSDGTASEQENITVAGPVSVEQADRLNPRPCGDHTIAVINDARNNQFVFCALGDGRVGVLENTWDPGSEQPLSDRISDPVELLHAVADDVPQEIVDAVRAGAPRPGVFVKGPPRIDMPHLLPVSSCNFTNFAASYCGTEEGSYWDEFASGYVHNHSSVYPDIDCTHSVKFCDTSGGWHQRTASGYQAYLESGSGAPWSGACASKERVLSCGGNTLFNTWRRETVEEGSWVASLANYWIAENTAAVWTIHSNAQGSCAEGADRDDTRFRADSEPGAYHNYSLMFIKWVDDTVMCTPTQ